MPEVIEMPCLVQTGQGFSVSYNGRLLYSKYAPQKAIVQAAQQLTLLPGTLILCASPCLWYGLPELLAKLPADCFVLGIEADKPLHALAVNELKKSTAQAENTAPFPVALLECDEILDIVEIILRGKTMHGVPLLPVYRFRRAIVLEMSGGVAFHADTYKQIAFAAENTIASFWKNRLTLTKLGRLFSRNVFHNLARLPHATPLANILRTVTKPIVVFGAGESAGRTIASVPRAAWKDYFVLAVDAALPVLLRSGIEPDGIVAVEAQLAIEKAYIGGTGTNALLFADMSSRAQVTAHTAGTVHYFASQFADTHFLADLQKNGLLPPAVPALGSVGLTATYLALNLRAHEDIPVYVTGLDFSFSLGATHTRGAPAHSARLSTASRLRPLANYDAAFRPGAQCVQGKNGAIYTDQALSGYAAQFAAFFAGSKNLFDAGESGIPLGILVAALDTDGHRLTQTDTDAQHANKPAPCTTRNEISDKALAKKVTVFFAQERKALERLKDLLMHGDAVKSPDMTVQEEISALLERREYLYLHFPDGYECRADDVSFLKRVRSEIDFFLKDLR